MASLLDVIGMVAGVAGLAPFLKSLLPTNTALTATTIRLVLGSSVNGTASFGGNVPGASLWDFNGSAIGFTDGSSTILQQGNFVDIKVSPNTAAGNIQAEYVSISNGGDDAICIAGLGLTFPDGSQAGFSTNVAAACGAFWANSQTPVLGQPASGEVDNPKCVWIDRNGSDGIPHQGMGLHIPSFSGTNANLGASYNSNQALMCKSGPRFRMYPKLKTEDSILVFPHPPVFVTNSSDPSLIGTDEDPAFIIGNPGIPAGNLITREGRRALRNRDNRYSSPTFSSNATLPNSPTGTPSPPNSPMAERLIISPHAYNSARELCESQTSFGHSFVSVPESLYCDMTDKGLYFTCSNSITNCCLDTDKGYFRSCKATSTRPPITHVNGTSVLPATLRTRQSSKGLDSSWMKEDKNYDSVQRW